MKKVSRSNLDALFAAIAEAKKLYLPVADGDDEKRGAKYSFHRHHPFILTVSVKKYKITI